MNYNRDIDDLIATLSIHVLISAKEALKQNILDHPHNPDTVEYERRAREILKLIEERLKWS